MATSTFGRQRRSDSTKPPCTSCGGSQHSHNNAVSEDFRCYWTQFSHRHLGLPEGKVAPMRKGLLHQFADWVEGNAMQRPKRGPDGPIPAGPTDVVRFFD